MTDTDLSAAAQRIVELGSRPLTNVREIREYRHLTGSPALAAEYLLLRKLEEAARGIGNAGVNVHVLPDLLVQLNQAIAALDQHRSKKP